MKSDGAVACKMEDTELDPYQLYLQLGMLVVESRLPDPSPKGRRQGPHCPVVLGEASWHICDLHTYFCRRARLLQKEMNTLWRNGIPMCIEVYILPDCYHGNDRVIGTDIALPTDRGGSLLLEQWTIQVLPTRLTNHPVSIRALFQAVQSHLYFSQLSAWLNRTHGTSPANISYRISPPGDFCTSSFPQVPVCHTFPVAVISKTLSMCVSVRCMPRMHDIPHVRCREPHSIERLINSAVGVTSPKQSSPTPTCGAANQGWIDQQHGRNSLRFQKARVVTEQPTNDMWIRRQAESRSPRQASSPQMSPPVAGPSNAINGSLRTSNTGAIPKCLSHKSSPTAFYRSECASSAPDSLSPERESMSQPPPSDGSSPKVIMTEQSDPQVYYGKEQDKVNWILRNVVNNNNSSTDSDSSSPDIDRYLSKNLTNRLDPLSPAEMESYLQNLCGSSRRGQRSTSTTRVFNMTSVDMCQSPCLEKSSSNQSECGVKSKSMSPVVDEITLKCSKSKDETDLSEMANSFSKLLRHKSSPDEFDKDATPTGREYASEWSTKSYSKRIEKGRSLQEADYRGRKLQSLSLPEPSSDLVTFSLSDEETEEKEKQYSNYNRVVQNGTSTNGSMVENSNGVVSNGSGNLSKHSPPLKSNLKKHQSVTDCESKNNMEKTHNDESVQVIKSILPDPEPTHALHKSISCPGSDKKKGFTLPAQRVAVRANMLLKTVMKRELSQAELLECMENKVSSMPIPTDFDKINFQKSLNSSANMIFHAATGLPLQSSPAPTKKRTSGTFEYDSSLTNPRAIKNSLSCANLGSQKELVNNLVNEEHEQKLYSTSAPASTNCLLGNFEESMLNGRLEPSGVVEGFTADIGASGNFCPKHITLSVTAFFFSLSDDNAPSPYLGHINLDSLGKRGYHVPKKGTVQVTLFNPNKTVVKMFVVVYDLADMPINSQTFLRQRTLYMPISGSSCDTDNAPVYLRYLIHLRFTSSKSGKIYLHTDIRLIFARDKFEFDSRVANYEMRSFTEGPINPKFSPKR